MTAKTLRKIDQQREDRNGAAKHLKLSKLGTSSNSSESNGQKPEGGNKLSKAMRRMLKFRAAEKALSDAVKIECDAEEQLFGGEIRDRRPDSHPFDERKFGDLVTRDVARDFPCSVVSLALFDGDTMLFACSGIPLPCGRAALVFTRYVTSARFAREYIRQRYRDDKLKIEVLFPDGTKIGGFLELHNRHVAIVTVLDEQSVHPVNVELQTGRPSSDGEMLVVGRAFESGCLMEAKVELVSSSDDLGWCFPVSLEADLPTAEQCLSIWKPVDDNEDDADGNEGDADGNECGAVAVLGGPVLGENNRIIGMNIDVGDGPHAKYVSFLPLTLLCRYLKHFRILNPKELHFRGYVFPSGVETIVPSGFMRRINRIKHYGYPMPPPLMLQLNGELCNTFEECFGESVAWKGYPFNVRCCSEQGVWKQLRKDVVEDISCRVVSVTSFRGYERYFVCTGLLIKWADEQTVVLTSASLVRTCDDENGIDFGLKIEVFLPPYQRTSGKLEFYNLNYNIAIVSLEEKFTSISPENICIECAMPKSSRKVVAIGRESRQGLLMATIGEVKRRDKDCKLECLGVQLSTCKIKKVGIGGPLINFDGSFVGMNHFDGRMLAPFVPRSKIVEYLEGLMMMIRLPLERPLHFCNFCPKNFCPENRPWPYYRWPVPELYWYHGLLDVDRKEHKHIGMMRQ